MARRKKPPAPVQIRSERRWILIAIAAAAFVIKLIVLLQLHSHPLLQPRANLDDAVYLDLAKRVASGDVVGGNRIYYVSPFYMYFLALALAITGLSVLGAQIIQIALGAVTVWLIGDLARTWFGERGGWIAATLAALTGYFTFNEILVLHSSVDAFLAAAGFWLLVRAWLSPSTLSYIAAGIVLGLHTLNRPNTGMWAAAAVILTFAVSQGGKTWMTRALTIAAGIVLAMAPVTIRNYAVSGEFAPISTHGGLNLYIGNHEQADGLYREIPGISKTMNGQIRDMQEVAGRALGRPVTDIEASSWFYQRAWTWIGDHPGRTVALFFKKIGYVFSAAEIPVNDSYAYYSRDEATPLQALIVGPWLLLPLGLAGIWLGRPRDGDAARRQAWWRFCAAIAVLTCSISFFFVVGRYRLPILVACCVTSAGAVLVMLEKWRARQQRDMAMAVVAVAVLGVLINRPLGIDDGRADWRAEMIVRDIEMGRGADAEALLAKTEPMHRNPSLLQYRTGKAYVSVGKAADAVPHFTRALALNSARTEIHLDLGHALLESGHTNEALPHLETALAAGVQRPLAATEIARALERAENLDATIADIHRASSNARAEAAALRDVGRAAIDLHDAPLALSLLQRSTSIAPEPETYQLLGFALSVEGHKAEGLKALQTAVSLDDQNPSAHLNLAVAYANAGRMDDAAREATEALNLKSDYEQAKNFLKALSSRQK